MSSNKTLKTKVFESGFWSFLNYGSSQVLRFLGNLLLTRLLFPEAFGVVAIAQTIIIGVSMLSDVGIRNSIIQHPDGDDQTFLDTCWSIQIIQGIAIAITINALAPFAASHYNQPELPALLAIATLGSVISSFTPTKYLTANRKLNIKLITMVDISAYIIGLASMIIMAYLTKSMYSLIWGGAISGVMKLILTHLFIPGPSNQFKIDKTKLKVIIKVGVWIFISTAITYFLNEGSKLLLASNMDVKTFALYNIANTMALIMWGAIIQIASTVLYPALSEVYRNNPANFPAKLLQSRLILLPAGWLTSCLLVFFGSELMDFLYDDRYLNSGSMLEIIAMGMLGSVIYGSYSVALFSMGEVKLSTILIAIEVALQLSFILIGLHYFGAIGMLWGIAASRWISYPFYAIAFHKKGILNIKLDLFVFMLSTLTAVYYWQHQL